MPYKPIIPYMGGKQRLAKKILPYFPKHVCYTEPFAGGLAMLLAKERSNCEVVNDISRDLVTLYRVIQSHPQEFEKQFINQIAARAIFTGLKKQNTELLTDIQRAARYFYLQKLCFGGNTCGQTFGTSTTSRARLNSQTLTKKIHELHTRLNQVFIENLDWDQIVKKYDRKHTLFYCDPPYWKTASYGVPFDWHQYEKLADHMNNIKGMMVLSINDHPDIRKLFSAFKIITLETTYTAGKQAGKAKELLILNHNAQAALEHT